MLEIDIIGLSGMKNMIQLNSFDDKKAAPSAEKRI